MKNDPLEPLAQSYLNSIGREEAPAGATCAEAYSLSSAISLKRIADAAEKLASCISDLESAPQNELAVFARCKDMLK